jgi:hypothetical protein
MTACANTIKLDPKKELATDNVNDVHVRIIYTGS